MLEQPDERKEGRDFHTWSRVCLVDARVRIFVDTAVCLPVWGNGTSSGVSQPALVGRALRVHKTTTSQLASQSVTPEVRGQNASCSLLHEQASSV